MLTHKHTHNKLNTITPKNLLPSMI